MGMPTPSAYVMAAVLAAPALVTLGVDPLAAHLFILYFAVMSAITPPVAVAAYAASSIADANPFSIALQSVRLSIVAFLIPYMFIYDAHLFLQGSYLGIATAVATAVIGVYVLSSGVEGWLFGSLPFLQRLMLIAAGIIIMFPGFQSDIYGILLLIIIIIPRYIRQRRLNAIADSSLTEKR